MSFDSFIVGIGTVMVSNPPHGGPGNARMSRMNLGDNLLNNKSRAHNPQTLRTVTE